MSPGKSSKTLTALLPYLRLCRRRYSGSLQALEGPVLGDAHRALALADDRRDLGDVEVTQHAQQHDLGLVGRQAAHERLDRVLGADPADRQRLGVGAVGELERLVELDRRLPAGVVRGTGR